MPRPRPQRSGMVAEGVLTGGMVQDVAMSAALAAEGATAAAMFTGSFLSSSLIAESKGTAQSVDGGEKLAMISDCTSAFTAEMVGTTVGYPGVIINSWGGGTPTTPSTPQITLEKTAEADSTISAGIPIYIKNTTHADIATTDTLTTASVAGLAISAATQGTGVTYRTEGTLALSDWTDATGAAALTTGSAYYLSSLGGLTITAPTAHGSFLVHIGRAISPDTLDISIQPPIAL